MERPLSGVRVVGLEQYMAGPYCTLLLADAGAEVIKIERPGSGDPRRAMPPFAERGGVRKAAGFMAYNRNKKSVALDIQHEKGREVLKRLVARADVVVENLRPGSLDRQGLGFKDMQVLNERLVWASISGFGRLDGFLGPYSDRPAFDIVAEAMSGIMHQVGFADRPPSWTIYGMADIYSGLVTAFGIVQALLMRTRTGRGQFVDSAMFDNMLSLNEAMIALHSVAGQSPERGKPKNLYPRGAYRTKDGYVAINVPDNIIWKRVSEAMGRPELADDARAKTGSARAANAAFLDPILEGWFAGLGRDEAVVLLNAKGVPCGPVNRAEDVAADPHVKARGMILAIDDPEVGSFGFARTAPHLSAAPTPPARPAPRLGEHTREILEQVAGYGRDEVDALAAQGVIEVGT